MNTGWRFWVSTEDKVRLYDPASSDHALNPAEVLANWDGIALEVSAETLSLGIAWSPRMESVFLIVLFFFLCCSTWTYRSIGQPARLWLQW